MKYGRERDTVSQSPTPESCFGDVTSLAPGNDDGCSKQTILVTAAILLVDMSHHVTAAVSRPTAALRQASVAERQSSSRLNGGKP